VSPRPLPGRAELHALVDANGDDSPLIRSSEELLRIVREIDALVTAPALESPEPLELLRLEGRVGYGLLLLETAASRLADVKRRLAAARVAGK
jgi:hypothetical protein